MNVAKLSVRFFVLPILAISLASSSSWAQRGGGPPQRIPDPQTIHLEGGSRVEFHEFSSAELGGQGEYSIFFPPAYDKETNRRFPVIYFLHGLNNDHTSWAVARYGNIPSLIENLLLEGNLPQFLMVHPKGGNSFYTDSLDGTKKTEQFIYKDLIQEVEKKFRVDTGRENRAIAGTSMGGYGALKIAMKQPELFSSVMAGSPIVLLGEDPSELVLNSPSRRAEFFVQLFKPVFGMPFDRDHWLDNSVELLARESDLKDLKVYFSYGTADRYLDAFPMEKGLQTIDQTLTERGISHVFRVFDGEPHGWVLIRDHLKEELEFLTQTF